LRERPNEGALDPCLTTNPVPLDQDDAATDRTIVEGRPDRREVLENAEGLLDEARLEVDAAIDERLRAS
jgi:hypothetical protein